MNLAHSAPPSKTISQLGIGMCHASCKTVPKSEQKRGNNKVLNNKKNNA